MNPLKLANLANTFADLHTQLTQAAQNISTLQSELQGAKTPYNDAWEEINLLQN